MWQGGCGGGDAVIHDVCGRQVMFIKGPLHRVQFEGPGRYAMAQQPIGQAVAAAEDVVILGCRDMAHRLTGQLVKAGGVKARDGRFCLAVSTFCHAAVPRRYAALCLCDLSYRLYYDVVSRNFADLSKKMDRFSRSVERSLRLW